MGARESLQTLIPFLVVLSPPAHALFGIQCTNPSDYRHGQIVSVSCPSTAKTNSWVTISLTAKNTGDCATMYRAYAEVPGNYFSQYSFPDYFWLDAGESKTVSMQLYTGGLAGSPTVKIKLESHYTALTYEVDSWTKTIAIEEESPSLDEQIQQTQDAIGSEISEEIDKTQQLLDSALSSANSDFKKSILSKLGNIHYALHIVGEKAASEDRQAAIEAQKLEIEITENAADALAIAVGHAFTPAAGAGQAVVQTVCAFSNFKNTPLGDIRNTITQRLLKNDIFSDGYVGEKQKSYITVYLGGPVANRKMGEVNERMRDLNLPYFEGNNLIAPDGRTYGWGYGVYAIIPDINPASIRADGTFTINVNELNSRIQRGDSRLYYVVTSGTNREGTTAAEKAYLETLEVAEEMSKVIKKGLCAGDLDEDDLYLIQDVLSAHAQAHALTALKHPESLEFGLEFTQSLMLLGTSDTTKEVKVRPMAMIVKKTGNSWTPVRVYYGV